jgi:nucleoside-diphosphate-sugar epimerase/glyoxylase-like metal-dependent hydrolase (beta-lactamase superfamily II)
MLQLCQNRDLVYHVGAKSSPWGTREEFQRSNVEGTQNVVDGCLLHKVPRLVYVSSTAIFFEFTDKQGIRDDAPFPQQFCCEYARSKAIAEGVVNKAVSAGLNAITIRARAVFGPGDNALLPRLIAAARQGRLRQIGDGSNTIDMTHIDNLVAALLLAARRGEAGTICTITNDEPIQLWPLLKQVLSELGICAQLRTVPRSLALMAASVLEWQHRFFNRSGEPLMTRYAAGLLSRTQTFDLASARTALGYEPVVGMQHAVRSTLATMKSKEETPANASVTLRMFSTGFTSHPAHLAEYGASKNRLIRFHAMVGVIDHPTEGLTLFDTGYSPAFFSSTERLPYKLYRWTTPVETCDALSIGSVLRRNGIEPESIRRIILSHFHADHVCGLKDFPDVEILASARAWHAINGKQGFAAVKLAILPGLFPADIERRLRLIDHFHGPGFGPFESTHDIFGDGSVRMVDLTGHAIGQIGLLLQRSQSSFFLE